MEEVKKLLAEGKLNRDDLLTLASCTSCGPDPPALKQLTKGQGNDEWLKARASRVTASDCAAICVSSASSLRAKNSHHTDLLPG